MKKLLLSFAFMAQLVAFAQNGSFQTSASVDANKSIGRSELKINAMRNFKKQFPNANETWSKKEDGFRARFDQHDIKYMVDYDQKGKWVSTIRIYDERDLSASVRKQVKLLYFDFSIVNVIEVKIGKSLAHFIKMENSSSLLTLHVMDGEITELENYRNASAHK